MPKVKSVERRTKVSLPSMTAGCGERDRLTRGKEYPRHLQSMYYKERRRGRFQEKVNKGAI